MRLAFIAPYRCPKCNTRFNKFHFRLHSLKKPHDISLAEFIGLRGSETSVRRWIMISLATIVLLFFATAFIFYFLIH